MLVENIVRPLGNAPSVVSKIRVNKKTHQYMFAIWGLRLVYIMDFKQ